jgi:signal peptidase I
MNEEPFPPYDGPLDSAVTPVQPAASVEPVAVETPVVEADVSGPAMASSNIFLDQPHPDSPVASLDHAPPSTAPAAPAFVEPTDVVGPWTRMGREIISGLQTLVSAAVYATLIVTFGFQVARVDGLSMAPTLEDHDRLIVNKLVYELGDPRPGDIVMLYYPLNPEKMFVKRVIAKEGDTVRIVDGRVYVNDIPLRDDYVPVDFRSHDDYGPTVVGQGYYFVMGDHRNNSSDSRHWGSVPKKYIVGKVKVRWWPLQDARIF